jgi:hypothetical protein
MTDGNAPAGEPAPGTAQPAASPSASQLPWRFQFTVAAALIVAFVVLTVFMLWWADAPDGVWKNRVFVFSSVEAIVFTAVGWIFGREVHRTQAESARKDAAEAKEAAGRKADEAAEERAKGMRLAGAVETLTAGPAGAGQGGPARDVGLDDEPAESGAPPSQLASLHDLVRRLYG